MSGCYRCGLPDGSESRLCDTCFACRFKAGRLLAINEGDSAASATGIELTPRMQRWLLSSGAVLYIGVVSLGLVIQGERAESRQISASGGRAQHELLMIGGNDFPVKHHTEFGFLAGPAGQLVSD